MWEEFSSALIKGNRSKTIDYLPTPYPGAEHVDARNATAWSMDHDKQGDKMLRD